ncbi:hypothetical protein Acr_29g0008620 [Actinidia rufa]|uniref:Retrotransposon gag domain-containing protein n=1 Tax=Actinidia rufa TaxID=165716 RepID=A0A7J0HEZ2_9ERIC|nr:hypothetical protein Acr_29g0008620 [Actinidia rufa]
MEPRQDIPSELAIATTRIFSSTTPTITGYSPDGNLPDYVSYISEISFHTYPSEDLAVIHVSYISEIYFHTYPFEDLARDPWTRLITPSIKKAAPPSFKGTLNTLHNSLQSYFTYYHHIGLIATLEGVGAASPRLFIIVRLCRSPFRHPRPSAEETEQHRLLVARPDFYHNSLAPSVGTIVLDLLCTCAAATYPDQVPAASLMRIMNENNGRLMQLLAAANPPLLAAPPIPDIERSRHSNRSGDRSQNISANRVGRGRRQGPSSSLREKSSSESSKTPTRSRRGRSPHKGDRIRTRDKSTSQKIRDLDARLDAINTGTNAPVTVDTLIRQTEPSFTGRILRARISSKFKLPTQLGIYEGKTDPMDHLDSYKSLMLLQGCSDEVMCKAFSAILKGPARSWFRKLSPGTIDSFGDLSRLFVANFMSCKNRQKNASHLFTDSDLVRCSISLSKNVPETLSALQSKADKYIAAEELAEAKRRRRGKDDHKRKEPDTRRDDYREETRYKRPDRDPKRSNNRRPRTPPRRPEFILPPLNAPVAQVLSEIKHEEFVKWPGKIKTDPQKRNKNKYCEFHRDHGHNTEDCFQLKEQIADLIKRGYLRKYVADRPPPNSPERRYGDNRPTAGNIQTIHGGFGSGGSSTSSRKRHARSAFRLAEEEIYNLSSPCVGDQTPITFSNDDLRGLHLPHDDALVVQLLFINCQTQRTFERPRTASERSIVQTPNDRVRTPRPFSGRIGLLP